MDQFILNDLLRRVAGGRTTQADADFLHEAFGRLDGWLDPRTSRLEEGRAALIVFCYPEQPEPCVLPCQMKADGIVEAVVVTGILRTNWEDGFIKLWRPWPTVPALALEEVTVESRRIKTDRLVPAYLDIETAYGGEGSDTFTFEKASLPSPHKPFSGCYQGGHEDPLDKPPTEGSGQ